MLSKFYQIQRNTFENICFKKDAGAAAFSLVNNLRNMFLEWSFITYFVKDKYDCNVYCIHFAFLLNLHCNENVFVMFL